MDIWSIKQDRIDIRIPRESEMWLMKLGVHCTVVHDSVELLVQQFEQKMKDQQQGWFEQYVRMFHSMVYIGGVSAKRHYLYLKCVVSKGLACHIVSTYISTKIHALVIHIAPEFQSFWSCGYTNHAQVLDCCGIRFCYQYNYA